MNSDSKSYATTPVRFALGCLAVMTMASLPTLFVFAPEIAAHSASYSGSSYWGEYFKFLLGPGLIPAAVGLILTAVPWAFLHLMGWLRISFAVGVGAIAFGSLGAVFGVFTRYLGPSEGPEPPMWLGATLMLGGAAVGAAISAIGWRIAYRRVDAKPE